jgi:DNA invertase Pin-like site-specific DNA recombinase
MSGASAGNRKALAKALTALQPGDVLLVTRLDRLARSTRDLLNVLDTIGKAGAGFKSLADTWADTTTPHGRLMLTVLGGLAEFERELIRARTSEGLEPGVKTALEHGSDCGLVSNTRAGSNADMERPSEQPSLNSPGATSAASRPRNQHIGRRLSSGF